MNRVKTIYRILTLTCDESTRLVSESLDRELPRSERIAVRLHVFICRSCRRARRQLLGLRQAIRRATDEQVAGPSGAGSALTPEARARIATALESHQDR